MRQITTIIFSLIIGQSLFASFMEGETFSSAPSGIYVPQRCETNDNVEIFFEGEFRDACHQVGMTSHFVDAETKSIYITDLAYYFGQDFCAMMTVPYQKGVATGPLHQGNWKVFFRHSRGNFVESGQVLPVREAKTQRPDDHLYAPVNKIYFNKASNGKGYGLELNGKFFNTCMKMDYVKVIQKPDSNVIEVLPIALMERGGCEEIPDGEEFNHYVDLKDMRPGRFLLHTRANNGRSVNEIVTIR